MFAACRDELEKIATKAQLKKIREAAASEEGNTPVALMKLAVTRRWIRDRVQDAAEGGASHLRLGKFKKKMLASRPTKIRGKVYQLPPKDKRRWAGNVAGEEMAVLEGSAQLKLPFMKGAQADVATTVGESVSNTRPMRKPKKKTIGAKPVDRAELTTYDSPRSVGDPQSERY